MTQDAAARSLVVERTMPHPPEKVWRALTQAPLVAEWLMQNDFQPLVGHRFNFRATPIPNMWNGVTDCEVLLIEPPRRLAFTWHPYGIDPDVDYDQEEPTLVEFLLAPNGDGTRLTVVESGFDKVPAHRREEAFRMNDGGWTQQVQNIKAHVES